MPLRPRQGLQVEGGGAKRTSIKQKMSWHLVRRAQPREAQQSCHFNNEYESESLESKRILPSGLLTDSEIVRVKNKQKWLDSVEEEAGEADSLLAE
jgi:hypothetical protein